MENYSNCIEIGYTIEGDSRTDGNFEYETHFSLNEIFDIKKIFNEYSKEYSSYNEDLEDGYVKSIGISFPLKFSIEKDNNGKYSNVFLDKKFLEEIEEKFNRLEKNTNIIKISKKKFEGTK